MRTSGLLLTCLMATLAAGCGQRPGEDRDAAGASSAPPPASTAPAEPAAPPPAPPPALPRTPSPAGASVRITSPAAGAVVQSPVTVTFAVEGMDLAPAGTFEAGTGHHHLLIDTPVPADLGQPLPNDENHRHFGKAQTEASIELPPGEHTLQLVLADGNHVPFDPSVESDVITITVQE